MRYIGGKSALLTDIENFVVNRTNNVTKIIDIFSGSGVVSDHFKSLGYNVIGNDFLYFAYVLSRGSTALNSTPNFSKLNIESPIDYLNALTLKTADVDIKDCFIFQNYSPHDKLNRMYFQNDNAIKIDVIRLTIEKWKLENLINEDEYFYLLAALIAAVPYVSNITGVYGAYLKHWDKRTFKPLTLVAPSNIRDGNAIFYNQDCDELLPKISADLLYADPPYNSRQYLPNYHILETVARYDYPEIHGVTGMRNYENQKSAFCSKSSVASAFRRMIQNANVRYVVISYNSEGLLSKEQLSEICLEFAVKKSFYCHDIDYRRYNNIGTKSRRVTEQLYFFEKG
jgi:adenine-specific DNA-methyltransferase